MSLERTPDQRTQVEATQRLTRHAARALADATASRREKSLARGVLALIETREQRSAPDQERGGHDATRDWFRQIFGVDGPCEGGQETCAAAGRAGARAAAAAVRIIRLREYLSLIMPLLLSWSLDSTL